MADKSIPELPAVEEKHIQDLPQLQEIYDDTLIPVSQNNEAHKMTGAQFRAFGEKTAEAYVQTAVDAAASAKADADRAEGYADTIQVDYDYIEKAKSDVQANAAAAKESENAAKASQEAAAKSETNAANSASSASTSETAAAKSMESAKESEEKAAASQTAAASSEAAAATSEANAKDSKTAAKASETNAAKSETASETSAKTAQSYAVGGTDTRENEDVDNARYYYDQAKRISQGLNGALLPMGTVAFADLDSQTKEPGYMYNISDAFTTDDAFKEGPGHAYPAGTNVYRTADGFWDCLAGAQVVSVNGRTGAVTVTKADVGLDKVENTPDSSKNVASAARLGASKSIFGQSFDGTNNVAGQGTFHGTYASDPRYRYGSYGLLIREQDEVGNTQTDVGYAPGIGFNWNNRYAASLVLDYGKFHFYDIDGVSPAPVRCILDDPSMYRHVAFPIGSTDNQDEVIDDLIQDISKQNRQFSFVSWEDARGDTYFGAGTSLLLVHAPRYDLATILAMNYQHSGLVFCQYRFGVLHRYDVQKTQLS